MIDAARGNLVEGEAEALVNTVNCVGYMGKGIALQFKQAFPENFRVYERACKRGEMQPGTVLVYETGFMHNPRYIINFPTKRHWRGKSKIEDLESGLVALIAEVRRRHIRSIAVPPLGCGHGGLEWDVVRPIIEKAFEAAPDVRVHLYAPLGAPEARAMPVRTKRPEMTPARALFVTIMDRYLGLAYRLTLLEIHKLAYFLQEAGEPLRLRYAKGHFGPYAPNLNKVLERIEGHFTRGYGDTHKPDVEIDVLAGAVDEAAEYLQRRKDSLKRLERVSRLIGGFETPYGMELLSSVHWVGLHDEPPATTINDAVQALRGWNERKRNMFPPVHIEIAWQRVTEQGWLPAK